MGLEEHHRVRGTILHFNVEKGGVIAAHTKLRSTICTQKTPCIRLLLGGLALTQLGRASTARVQELWPWTTRYWLRPTQPTKEQHTFKMPCFGLEHALLFRVSNGPFANLPLYHRDHLFLFRYHIHTIRSR